MRHIITLNWLLCAIKLIIMRYYFYRSFLLFYFFLSCNVDIKSQDTIAKNIFISLNSGCFLQGQEFLKSNYYMNPIYSNYVFINGFTIGIPTSDKLFHLYIKGMYFKDKGILRTYNIGDLISPIETIGSSTLTSYIFNLGCQYIFLYSKRFDMFVQGGLTGQHLKIIELNGGGEDLGVTSFFLGFGLELNANKIPISVFSEVQFNDGFFVIPFVMHGNFNTYNLGTNINIGIKYYISKIKY